MAHSGSTRGSPGVRSRDTWHCRAASRVVLRLDTRGILGRHPEGFARLGVLGTRGLLAMLPGILSRLITRDTWLTRNVPGNTLSVEHSGHVAHSEGFRRVALGVGFRGHVALSEGKSEGSLGVAFGTRVVLRRVSKEAFGVGFGQAPKGFLGRGFRTRGMFRRGVPKGLSVNPALSSDKIIASSGARLVASSDLPAVFKCRQITQRGGEMVANGGVTPVTRRGRDRLMQAAWHLVKRDEGDMASATEGVALAENC